PSLHTSHLAATSTSYLYIHTPTPHIYTLSLHDALPISINSSAARSAASSGESFESSPPGRLPSSSTFHARLPFERSRGGSISSRSEEHTSELQSRFDLVCRLLLEKKKKN